MRISLKRFVSPIDWKEVGEHGWFAWHPVLVADWEWRWMEYVRRKWVKPTNFEHDNGYWEYSRMFSYS